MIQDIAPHQFKNEYRAIPPKNDSVVLYYEACFPDEKDTAGN